tara:strand:+ start:2601 stop:3827 length:1227 start_codon:yes stop_codon:yes gene_type:complete
MDLNFKKYISPVLGKSLSVLFTLYFTYIITNNFNNTDSSFLFLTFSIIQFYIIFARFGQDQILVKKLGGAIDIHNTYSINTISSFLIITIISLVFILLNIFLSDLFYIHFFNIHIPIFVFYSIFPLAMIWGFVGVLRYFNFQFLSNFYENGLFYSIFIIGTFCVYTKPINYLYLFLFSSIISFALISIQLYIKGFRLNFSMLNKLDEIKSSRNITMSTLGSFLIINLPLYLAAFFGYNEHIVLYAVCIKISFLISVGSGVIASIYAPIYSKHNHLKDNTNLRRSYNKSRREIIAISFLVLLFVYIFSIFILKFFNLVANENNILLVRLFCFAQFLCVSTGNTGLILNITSNDRYLRNYTYIGLVISFVFCLFYIQTHPSIAMLISYSIGIIFENFLSLMKVNRCLKKK